MISREKLADLRTISICDSAKSTLTDITGISVDPSLPVEQRLERFVQETGNPYLFRVGETVVKIQYGDSQISLQERLRRLAKR